MKMKFIPIAIHSEATGLMETSEVAAESEEQLHAHSAQAINVTKRGQCLARRVQIAQTSAQRRKGLLGRIRIEPDEGLYIAPCEWIHTFGMKVPIDVAFLARDGRILLVHHSLKPNRLSKIAWRALGVLELAAGRLEATDTSVGDVIEFRNEIDSVTFLEQTGPFQT